MVMEVGATDDQEPVSSVVHNANDVNRETNEVTSRLDAINDTLTRVNARAGMFDITQLPQSTHVKMVGERLVLSATAACTVTITIGTRTYVFTFTATMLYYDVPFPRNIERGVDISAVISGGGGAALTAFLIYKPE